MRRRGEVWQLGEPTGRFFGSFSHALDAKGRLTLPVRFRGQFGDQCFVTPSQYEDPCLVVWRVEDFNAFVGEVRAEHWADPEERRRLRSWASEAFEAEIDRLGRLMLPPSHRAYANLDHDVRVHGAFGTVELWDPATWERYRGGDRG
ncbi:division/cell wall cluster transcriptional repressor MraZ [Acidimicrobium ferrooxidans]|uniref:division/cell wall cluster transcriptional repressor MraZ n=1 Tax=Acidimicrobium ferrooxidans TaxID=53635 RepID=UPI0014948773|nr:cell division/cell wall cluster transcriptional repressor MraZ [Acidimicrobium ferrooxidans]